MANKIIVSQIGARHRYVIPRVLEKSGLLYRFYTDSSTFSVLGCIASLFKKLKINSKGLSRLCGRQIGVSKDKVFSSDALFVKTLINTICHKDIIETSMQVYDGLSKTCIRWGVGDADCVYGMYFENFSFLKYAKEKGLKVVVDIYERPLTYKLLSEEIKSNEEYKVFQSSLAENEKKHEVRMRYIDDLLTLADYYTIPSKKVIESLRAFTNFDEKKVLYLPYASSIVTKEYAWNPQKHRLLFVGSDIVNKGLLYCAKAASRLKITYPDLDFRIVGLSRDEKTRSPVFDDLNFIGFLDREQLVAEYCSAEVFVFPTLFEGFAGAIIEAASCGCPIITTDNAGTDTEVFPAIYIPEKDVNAIVESVVKIFEDSELRDSLSKKVFEYSKNYTPEEYGKKLIGYLSQI
jgi:glycosyltransferase involved in cell wall biosynthesis